MHNDMHPSYIKSRYIKRSSVASTYRLKLRKIIKEMIQTKVNAPLINILNSALIFSSCV